jgi:putative component of toxin-antitoxin plasmid stabilization module
MENKPISINSIKSIQKLTQLLRESSNDAVISTKIENRIEKLRLKNKKINNVVADQEEEVPCQDAEGYPITLFKSKQLLNKYCTNYNKKTQRRKSPTELDIQMIEKHIKGSFCNQVDKSLVIDEVQLPPTETVILDIKQLLSMENDYDIIELKLVMRNKIKN